MLASGHGQRGTNGGPLNLVGRSGEFSRIADVLLPFLVTRQLICGAGKVLQTPRGAVYCLSQRAEHIWEGVSSATTRSRPIINTRDEPHADAERYRRLHVIVGDSNMSEVTTLLKVGTANLVLEMVEHGVQFRDFSLDYSLIDREVDWAIKHRLLERYRNKHGLELSSPRIAQLDLAYHDIRRGRGLFDMLQRKDLVDRATDDGEIEAAKDTPPQSTRAKLRGDFIAAAQAAGRDFTVDWVHLKLNDQAQRTVLCKDPFRAVDERVERLISSL